MWLSSHFFLQAFDGGDHLAHSGMNASAVYLFERIYSLAQVCLSLAWHMLRLARFCLCLLHNC